MRYILTIAIIWLSFCAGCAKGPAIYVDQLSPIPLKSGQSFTAPQDGWFLTDATFEESLTRGQELLR